MRIIVAFAGKSLTRIGNEEEEAGEIVVS